MTQVVKHPIYRDLEEKQLSEIKALLSDRLDRSEDYFMEYLMINGGDVYIKYLKGILQIQLFTINVNKQQYNIVVCNG